MSRVVFTARDFLLPMRYLILLFCLGLNFVVFAQQIQVAYVIHNFNQPGITISAPQIWTQKIKEKDKKKGIKQIGKSNILLPQFTYYNHVRKENNFTLGCELVRQRIRMKPANWTFETGIGLHYVRSFNAGKTFKVRGRRSKTCAICWSKLFCPFPILQYWP